MWYRIAQKKFTYSPLFRKKQKKVTQFADEVRDEDRPQEIDVNKNPELLPADSINQPSPEVSDNQTDDTAPEPQAPLVVDAEDPAVQSDNIGSSKNVMPPPQAPHDGCRCSNKIRQKISGGYEWQVDASMCQDCQAAAREYNRQSMDNAGVNAPINI
jgi:hypothetical protein